MLSKKMPRTKERDLRPIKRQKEETLTSKKEELKKEGTKETFSYSRTRQV